MLISYSINLLEDEFKTEKNNIMPPRNLIHIKPEKKKKHFLFLSYLTTENGNNVNKIRIIKFLHKNNEAV